MLTTAVANFSLLIFHFYLLTTVIGAFRPFYPFAGAGH